MVKNFTSKTAVIDIGSNSVRLAFIDNGVTISKRVETTKLTKNMSSDKMLDKDSIIRTVNAVSSFYNLAIDEGYEVLAFGTAGLRLAKNSDDFMLYLSELCDLNVEIISGEEEAYYGAIGALEGNDGAVIDVGGASTELTVFRNGKIVFSKSVNVGAVTLTDTFGSDIDGAKEYLKTIFLAFDDVEGKDFRGIGGTATSIAGIFLELNPYDPTKTHGLKISVDYLNDLVNKLYSMSLEERKNMVGLQPARADIIPCGVLILTELLIKLNAKSFTVSEKDNIEGYFAIKGRKNG